MRVRQSDLKTWMKCPLLFKFQNVDGLPREQSGSLTYGSILHDCVLFMEVNQDLAGAVARFHELWQAPTLLGAEYHIDYYVKGTNWKKFNDEGPRVLKDWWSIISWDAALTLAREYSFEVPVGSSGNTLVGTVDKLEVKFRADVGSYVVNVSDYKTNKKTPTYDYLAEDLQFSAYGYATTRPEFWTGIPNGQALFEQYRDLPRYGEWVQLTTPRRMDAGVRTQRHYNRVGMAVDGLADSLAMGIFVPNISGETCRYCEYRKPCGLPELDENGQEVA